MEGLQFRQTDSIADWQIMLLALFCMVLIMLWFGIKRYASQRNISGTAEQPVSNRYKLATGQMLHQIRFQGKEYLVLESRFGMTQLDVKEVSVE
ncbi:hypothetical protein [Arsukibacterium perlucidum]|uniref:hypothetical protein n=1 Tax=Arsukibacterium perlucidum TaxID=368811 RepID=UPI00036E141F|nr:hypothetical protein [Arsukibacterium perlucidum]